MALDYPGGFKVPAFPAGPSIALARWMGIATAIVFLIICFLCGMILWAAHTRTIDPFIFSVNRLTGQWEVVGHTHHQNRYTSADIMQIASISNFVQNWFAISTNPNANAARWAKCSPSTDCQTTDGSTANPRLSGDETYALCCSTTEALYNKFAETVLPDYELRAEMGEHWRINLDTLQVTQTRTPNVWQITATIVSNMGDFDILAYVHVSRSDTMHMSTAGFFVEDFDAYRIN